MRLTLRTLLAYLDDLLEPQAARDLGERITRSEDAAAMVSRIKEVVRKRRVEAPPVDESSGHPTANTVAAYLDNTLPQADVEAFETTAMEDDTVLAETASTHQILSVVLAEPVEVDSELRLRMYGLAGMDASRPTEEPAVPVVGSRKSTVEFRMPDEPKTSKPRNWLLLAALLLLTLGLWGLLASQFLRDREKPVVAGADVPRGSGIAEEPLRLEGVAIAPPLDGEAGDPVPVAEAAAPTPQPNRAVLAADGDGEEVETPTLDPEESPASGSMEPGEGPVVVEVATAETAADESASVAAEPAASEMPVADASNEGRAADGGDAAAPAVASIFANPDGKAAGEPKRPNANEAMAKAEPPSSEMEPFEYQSAAADEIVLHIAASDAGSDWTMLPARAMLFPNERVAVPPLYVGAISLKETGLSGQFIGPAEGGILPPDETSRGGLSLNRGRLILRHDGEKRSVGLAAGGIRRELELPDGSSVLTLAVDGPDARLSVRSGSVTVENGEDGKPIATGQTVSFVSLDPVEPPDDTTWTETVGDDGPLLDRRYRLQFASSYDADAPATLQLSAMVSDPSVRVSQMAAATLGLLDRPIPLAEALSAEYAETRATAIRELRRMLADGSVTPVGIRQTLATLMTESDATTAIELLRGYDAEELRSPSRSQTLVRLLESESVLIRQLAVGEIARHSGRDFDFQPDGSRSQRAGGVARARDWLKRRDAFVTPAKTDDGAANPLRQ